MKSGEADDDFDENIVLVKKVQGEIICLLQLTALEQRLIQFQCMSRNDKCRGFGGSPDICLRIRDVRIYACKRSWTGTLTRELAHGCDRID
jgi:hypothetical protein